MRFIVLFGLGLFFGIVMTKSEAVSWFRIHEMFRFESFHMYGIIGVAVVIGAGSIALLKALKVRTLMGTAIDYPTLPLNVRRHLLAGSFFGLGWALIGACPGPMFVLLGQGYLILVPVLVGALVGTYTYGAVRNRLPH